MSETSTERPVKRRSAVLAFVLNALAAPTGYVYAGRLRLALLYVPVVLTAGALIGVATLWRPPGVYGDLAGLGATGRLLMLQAVLALGLGVHAATAARNPRATSVRGAWLWLLAVGLWLAPLGASVAVRAFGPVSTYSAASDSMAPTLRAGDIVAVKGARASCGRASVQAGDVIVFTTADGDRWMHRAVAGPGAVVQVKAGRLSIDGAPVRTEDRGSATVNAVVPLPAKVVRETLPNGAAYDTLDLGPDGALDDFGPVTVPAGTWFVMGDSRDNAVDSRVSGPIPESRICGVAFKLLHSQESKRIGSKP